jgi:hypothetical protein
VKALVSSSSYLSSDDGSRDSSVPSQAAAKPSGMETIPGFSHGKIGSAPLNHRPFAPITVGPTAATMRQENSPTTMPTTAPTVVNLFQ